MQNCSAHYSQKSPFIHFLCTFVSSQLNISKFIKNLKGQFTSNDYFIFNYLPSRCSEPNFFSVEHTQKKCFAFKKMTFLPSLYLMKMFWTPLTFIVWTKIVLQNIFFCILKKDRESCRFGTTY